LFKYWLCDESLGAEQLLGSPIAAKLVGNDHSGMPPAGAQQLAKEAHSGKTVALRLYQNVNDGAVLVDRTPEIVLRAIDLQEHFVQEPFVTQLGPFPLQFVCIGSSEDIAPATDRLVAPWTPR
jgi:hypothetical protein